MKSLIYIFLFLGFFSFAQETIEASFINKKELQADKFIGTNNFETTYFIQDNVFIKNDKERKLGDIEYSNVQLRKITSANTFNPLKINVFYKDFNTVIILDNRLSEMFKIDFNTIQPFKDITYVSTGNDNTIWVFNRNTQQLESYDYKANKTRVQTLPIQGEVLELTSNYNFCWLLTATELYTYNYFGSLISKIENDGFTSIKENNGNLFLLKENTLFFIANGSDEIKKILLPNLLIKQFLVTNETLYIYDGELLHQYQLKMN